jgi:serine/threonine-protein kinase RsbW
MEALMEEQTFPGTLDSLEPVRSFVMAVASKYGLERRSAYKLCLAVDEIATNIVTHGYQEAGLSGDITVGADLEGNKLVIRLEDRGRSYDPLLHAVPRPEHLATALEARYPGGLGILLAQMGVDELQYSKTPHGNVHRFIVTTTPVPAHQRGLVSSSHGADSNR